MLIDDIDPARLLLLEDGHCLKDHALAACTRAMPQSEARIVASTLHTLVQMVDAGLGVTLIPEIAVRAGILEHTGVVTRELASPTAQRQIALAWRRNNARAQDFRMLGQTILDALKTPAPGQPSVRKPASPPNPSPNSQ